VIWSASPSISTSTSQADIVADDERIGEIYLSAAELAARVRELGAEIARDYEGREPLLVGSLKASVVFAADLSRAMPIVHRLDFIELAGYGSAQMGGHEQIRVLKDLDLDIRGRDVLVVEDVVDTGLTLNYLVRTFELREPRSVAAVTLLDRPYRRLVDDLPVRYVGFVVPDELYVGYGFDLEERYRELPDLHLLDLTAKNGS
jgi:hypoxanthine phosphoribosyltransferase